MAICTECRRDVVGCVPGQPCASCMLSIVNDVQQIEVSEELGVIGRPAVPQITHEVLTVRNCATCPFSELRRLPLMVREERLWCTRSDRECIGVVPEWCELRTRHIELRLDPFRERVWPTPPVDPEPVVPETPAVIEPVPTYWDQLTEDDPSV